jgi:hypothetical protein
VDLTTVDLTTVDLTDGDDHVVDVRAIWPEPELDGYVQSLPPRLPRGRRLARAR